MSVLDIPLRKILQLFYAPLPLQRSILKEDIRLDRKKEQGGSRSRGGDFYLPFWSDVKKHIAGDADLSDMTDGRIRSNKRFRRLYPLLKDGVIDLLSAKLRWSNEPVQIVPKSVHGNLQFGDIGGTVRIRDALHARVRGEYTRIVYPYFSEEPALPEEGGRLGLWAMQQALTEYDPNDMRVIDILRRTFFSPQTTPLRGDEGIVFREKYILTIAEWERLKLD
ncbi:hypothetical protein CK231_03425 [Mesorhizobium loti]|uniref:Uncharacterized protein n=2 Tax=Mesorhizobium TaxID=68287 RepID=A0A1A5IZB3_RHILI|nr:hypothetical protein [Mesorhizobium loti]MBE1715400.1 hypothetical protein [Mesorhizobium japonicum]QGX77647.1 hypothetical protein EB234_12595 [Mesorhizobium japonicum R7A]OBP78866.1 hypothetical protein BAE39_29055 [Mesorhizobium loti]OBP80105.1 hypothetical protein BAE42_00005 [Mesorhizobium loti]OBP84553.1 hypothetical protein BAE38_24145 [Mesorhizobium loti]